MNSLQNKKTAIVYDRVNKWGGAERVLLALHEIFPEASLYTSVYDEKKATWANVFPNVYTSFLQKIPVLKNYHELLGWMMPIAFEQFDFSGYDLVISVTSESSKGVITLPKTKHICIMLTPTRYLWSGYDQYFKNSIFKLLSYPIVSYLRWWDKIASQRPDKIISISNEVKKRVKKYYDRDSLVIFPPVEITPQNLVFKSEEKISVKDKLPNGAHYLAVTRLVAYKRVDLLVEVFNKLKLPLVIVGTGAQGSMLKLKANKNIKFLGKISDGELQKVYKKAVGFLMPQEEDFGIAALEAQSFGVPVIAYNRGGALDTVVQNKTGVFFNEQTKASLIAAIEKFQKMRFNRNTLISNAKKFSKERFKKELIKNL